jgi:hypothetical protein
MCTACSLCTLFLYNIQYLLCNVLSVYTLCTRQEHLPLLVPFLLQQTADAVPQVRLMACWCLSRYADWILQQDPEEASLFCQVFKYFSMFYVYTVQLLLITINQRSYKFHIAITTICTLLICTITNSTGWFSIIV